MSRSRLGSTFWRFWSGSAISQLGDGVRVTALPLLAAAITRDPVAVASITAAVWLPWLLFGFVGGAIVDRTDRRRIMRDCQLVRMLVTAGLAVAVWLEYESIPLLAVAAFVIGLAEVLVDSALYSVVPRVVPDELLENANGRLGAAELVGNDLGGPPLGGVLFSLSPWIPFALDSATFGASGLMLTSIRGDFKAHRETDDVTSLSQDVREGLKWLVGHKLLRVLALGIGAINLSVTGAWAVLVLLALQVLDVSGIGFGLLLSCSAIGGLIGNLIGASVARVIGRAKGMTWSLAVSGLAAAAIGLTTNAFVVGGLILIEGLMIGIFNVIGRTLRQVLTPDHLLGRVTSGFRTLSYGMASVGALIGGSIADAFGLQAPFVVGGVLVFGVGVLMGIWINERAIVEARARVG